MTRQQQHTFDRDQVINKEPNDAIESVHVKRTAQEDLDPEVFL